MMDIALINAPMGRHALFTRKKAINPDMHSLAAVLRHNGLPIRMLNAVTRDLTVEEVVSWLNSSNTSDHLLAFFPLQDGAAMINAAEISRQVRCQRGSAFQAAFAGHAASIAGGELLKARGSDGDFVIAGELEETSLELCRRLEDRARLDNIPGISQLQGAHLIHGPARPAITDLDVLPTAWSPRLGRVGATYSSRGCPERCSFCNVNYALSPQAPQHLWRGRSVETVTAELCTLATRGVRFVEFCDANFAGGQAGIARARMIASELQRLKAPISFSTALRADDVVNEADCIGALKYTGLRRIEVGLESANPDSLRAFAKRTNFEINQRCVDILTEHGLDIQVEFIMFTPWTQIPDIRRNLEFLRMLFDRGFRIRKALFNPLRLEAGSALTRHYKKKGTVRKGRFFCLEYPHEDASVATLRSLFASTLPRAAIEQYHASARVHAVIDGEDDITIRTRHSAIERQGEELVFEFFGVALGAVIDGTEHKLNRWVKRRISDFEELRDEASTLEKLVRARFEREALAPEHSDWYGDGVTP
jgi:radical SAM superfamily enzyme YgiQ (UPF0313 family)